MFRRLARIINVVASVVVVLALLAAGAVYVSIDGLHSKVTAEVDIPSGTSVAAMGELLTDAHVIQTPHLFSLWARVSSAEGSLKAGFYEFPAGMTLREVGEKIERGEVKSFPFTIIEGWTIQGIARALGEQPFLAGTDVVARFLVLSRDPVFVASLGIAGATSLEGYLFPDTYRVTLARTAEDILRQLVARFHEVWTPVYDERATVLGLSAHQVMTLASIVEKETGAASERPRIASVFLNRLKLGMPLQSDPTVIYGLPHFDGNLRKDDLSNPHHYNTYVHPGLPPGPIASPGKASIEAVLSPAETKYLYFVAKGDGTHEFTSTLSDHLRAVMRYQLQGR